ncbi:hypothetical protein, partial [Rhizobium ecuadorense]|uniref:hypothetical protein n=1 Tax=Rhizobium ecuadorense TaxID=1671795 RepID=UPI00136490CE
APGIFSDLVFVDGDELEGRSRGVHRRVSDVKPERKEEAGGMVDDRAGPEARLRFLVSLLLLLGEILPDVYDLEKRDDVEAAFVCFHKV